MSSGKCLCSSVSWQITGTPVEAYHCHCSMCRKAHGAAFGTYYLMAAKDFQWTSDRETIVDFVSSPSVVRCFCGVCGSVVPQDSGDGELVYVPAGCHDEGPGVNAHIFAGSKAPWHDISDNLACYDAQPEGNDLPAYPDKPLASATEGIVRGSCLCGVVEFQVSGPFKVVHNCHCSRCRQARSAAYTTNGFTHMDAVHFTKGEQHQASYKLPTARFFTHSFCDICGSGLPRIDSKRKIAVIPMGVLDDDPKTRPVDNIFVGNKAAWVEICDDLPAFDQYPPG